MTCWSKAWREGEARTEISPAGNMGPEIFLVSPAAAAAEGACQPHDAAVSATHFCGLASSDERPPSCLLPSFIKSRGQEAKPFATSPHARPAFLLRNAALLPNPCARMRMPRGPRHGRASASARVRRTPAAVREQQPRPSCVRPRLAPSISLSPQHQTLLAQPWHCAR